MNLTVITKSSVDISITLTMTWKTVSYGRYELTKCWKTMFYHLLMNTPLIDRECSIQIQRINIRIPPIQLLVRRGRTERSFSNSASFSLGVTLILGFVFMLIIDHCGSRLVHSHGNQSRMFSVRGHANILRCLLSVLDSSGSLVISKPKASWTATLGLVVHAAADGIALGKENRTIRDIWLS